MSMRANTIAVKIDASVFEKHVGDSVKKGDVLGEFAGNAVPAPCDGVIEGTSFAPEDHALIVAVRCAEQVSGMTSEDPHFA